MNLTKGSKHQFYQETTNLFRNHDVFNALVVSKTLFFYCLIMSYSLNCSWIWFDGVCVSLKKFKVFQCMTHYYTILGVAGISFTSKLIF